MKKAKAKKKSDRVGINIMLTKSEMNTLNKAYDIWLETAADERLNSRAHFVRSALMRLMNKIAKEDLK